MAVVAGVRDVELLSTPELVSFLQIAEVPVEGEERPSLLDRARHVAVRGLSVAELRETIEAASLSFDDCSSRDLLRERAVAAILRLRQAKRIPGMEEALRIRDERLRKAVQWRRYHAVFAQQKLGLSVALARRGSAAIIVTRVGEDVGPRVQPGDQIVAINDAPFNPSTDGSDFRLAVLDRLQLAPRPVTLTLTVGDGRWPPHAPSVHHFAVRARARREAQRDDDDLEDEPPPARMPVSELPAATIASETDSPRTVASEYEHGDDSKGEDPRPSPYSDDDDADDAAVLQRPSRGEA